MDYDMPEIQGIDWEKAHHYIPEKTVLITVLREFVGSARKQTELLAGFKEKVISDPEPENFASYRIQAHAMKASLRSLGSDLFDEAFALENAGIENNIDPVINDTDAFLEKYLSLSESFKVITGDCDVNADFDEAAFFELVDRLSEAMDAFDVTGLQETFDAMQKMDIPDKYREQTDLLQDAVRDLESDTVIRCCENIRGMR